MAKLLVLLESDGARILPASLPAISFAQKFSPGDFDLLAIGGPGISQEADQWRGFGAQRIWVAESSDLAKPTADRYAAACVQALKSSGAFKFAGTSSSFGRDILPRVAGLLDAPMLSDVMSVETDGSFRRPMYAGNIVATVRMEGDVGGFSVRGTAFDKPATGSDLSAIESLSVDGSALPKGTTWLKLEAGEQKRPDLTTAPVVVSGGRPLKDAETFERILGGLADKLGGAVGATRAAVDAGIAANELQVGQTGKVVAPDLYFAVGVSGSVQHLAGMKDSKVIVAINTDPDAPIFSVADYGLVADLYEAVPEITAKL